jgi:hypothetical protein
MDINELQRIFYRFYRGSLGIGYAEANAACSLAPIEAKRCHPPYQQEKQIEPFPAPFPARERR